MNLIGKCDIHLCKILVPMAEQPNEKRNQVVIQE